ncbi:Zinc carboxypeptidase [Muriicola jejuensis]|uniref:Zinc carboxypeptidase n=1 Tax=Muriicola jejuensis TaxID=504488 RepID=A0A6P0U8Z9_9FLAO|nr:M14 family metallopeptidase [Muriicola jejuensis]NER09050.1 zinc carboxypeptidase [Muriicola jejuensis]SMP11636.1 Zinc carboxypeptidase [Muriicola jejuensis]
MRKIILLALLCLANSLSSQEYFLEKYKPFNSNVPSPEEFLGYGIGERHTRHDLIVAYLKKLAEVSERARYEEYGRTHEGRILGMLILSTPGNLSDLPALKEKHLAFTDPEKNVSNYDEIPVFINLAYNVHGNEPSSSEAALLAAYTFAASESGEIQKYLRNAVIFIDPTINPDGRDRHTQWANSYQGNPLVADPQDAEHDEYWPGGRTNHYWFDLNRDWLLAINPESRGKLNWYHQWYPNVVTDFHEMGSQSTYFFEPMKDNGSLDPIMPRENYVDLNNLFGDYYAKALDSIGSLYFTKEVFDGTYPGYGSSYPDLQGGLGLLFEQASSRGHKQTTAYGEITFPFTIRNQFTSSITTVRAAVENKAYLRKYQQDFFKSALSRAAASRIKGYAFGDAYDKNREKAFIDKLLLHRIKVYKNGDGSFFVPTRQPQYRMVQTVFETYTRYRDSVFYDASAWSLANFYNMSYSPLNREVNASPVTSLENLVSVSPVERTGYAYLIDWDDYNAPAALHYLQSKGLVLSASFRTFTSETNLGNKTFNFGTLILPVKLQKKNEDEVFSLLQEAQQKFSIPVYSVQTGLNVSGVDLGSRFVEPVEPPKAAMIIGEGVRSYEAGEVWHLLDTRIHMPITKIPIRSLKGADLDKYNTLVMVSGSYSFDEKLMEKIKAWAEKGNTLITIGTASKWAIDKKLVAESLIEEKKDSSAVVERKPYADAGDNLGKESVGGIIAQAELDLTHPLAFGYRKERIPVYKNNTVWLAPSKNEYATVARYTQKPVIDGFITDKNRDEFLVKSASLIVSPLGRGRVVMFADNPNFRGSWYGTNRLFLNALFLGNHINVPK